MELSEKGIRSLIQREGSKNKMYRDSAGLPTIGIGHLLTQSELRSGKITALGVKWHLGLTDAQAMELFHHDTRWAREAVDDLVTVPLTQNQYDALVSFVFNIGAEAFKNSTLLHELNQGRYDQIPSLLRRWIHSAGKRDPILVARRETEIEQWKLA
jgi:lysozyme